jgi:Flp pilus assembly protein TadG
MKTESRIETNLLAGNRKPAGARRTSGRSQRGASFIELALMMPLLSLLLVGVIDMGRAFYLSIEVNDAARAGAQYAFQNSATEKDNAGITTAATSDAPDVPGITLTPAPVHGCMCSDGTNQSANCTTTPTCNAGSRVVNYVNVNTRATYTPIFTWPGVPSSITIRGQALLVAGD